MVVKTYVIPKGSDHPFINVYPPDYPGDFAGKVVAANSDSTSHVVLSEVPAGAVFCGDYCVTITSVSAASDPRCA